MITEWTYDLTVPKAEVAVLQDTRDSSRVTPPSVVDGAAKDLDTDVSVEETEVEVELIGWFE